MRPAFTSRTEQSTAAPLGPDPGFVFELVVKGFIHVCSPLKVELDVPVVSVLFAGA